MQIEKASVTIAAVDFNRSTQFYRQMLNADPIAIVPNVYAEFKIADLRLGIYQPRQSERIENSRFPTLSLCLQVEDLERAIKQLNRIGSPPTSDTITTSHGRELYVYDPDGNRIILYQPARN